MVVSLREFIFVIASSVVLSLAILATFWPWTRRLSTLATIALTTTAGIVLWNLALNVTNATWLNVDSPFLGLSVQDIGSGVGAFVVTLAVLRFVTDRSAPVNRVLGASAVVGAVTVLVDLVG